MKIRVKERELSTQPKQSEGRLVVGVTEHSVKPKPAGVIIQKMQNRSVFKTDEQTGIILKKQQFTRILKQND
jgi:hypothetical protein